jgi:phosphoketolase
MDSQEQYEALLKNWGYKDTTVEDHARRQKRAIKVKAVVAFFKVSLSSIQKINTRPQQLNQANL